MSGSNTSKYDYLVKIEFEGAWEGLKGGKDLFSEPPTNDVSVFTKNKENAKELSEEIKDTSIGHLVESVEMYESGSFPHNYREPKGDWDINGFPYHKTRNNFQEKVEDALTQEVIQSEHYQDITALNQVKDVFKKVHPLLTKFNLLYESKKKLKDHIKRNDQNQLSKASQNMLDSNNRVKSGEESENKFREVCNRLSLSCMKTQQGYRSNEVANPEFQEKFPEVFDEMINNFGIKEEEHDRGRYSIVTGLPDFIVWGQNEKVEWVPSKNPFFVEVKSKSSKLTDTQKTRFPKIRNLGYEILIFRDEGENYSMDEFQ